MVHSWYIHECTFFIHMKNTSILILLSLVAICPLFGQKFYLGALSGINFPNIHSEIPDLKGIDKGNRKQTMIYGIGLLYSVNNYINLRSEFFYEERGWLAKNAFTLNAGNGDTDKSKIDFFYPFITLPLLVEGKIGKKWQFFINSGINTSLRIGGKAITENGDVPLVFVFPEDKKPTFDYAWVGGSGLRAKLNKKVFFQIESRYYYSWTPIGVGYSYDSVMKHKGFLFSIAGYYALGRKAR
jgi:hypothetical protein